jgi:hypothetical protein
MKNVITHVSEWEKLFFNFFNSVDSGTNKNNNFLVCSRRDALTNKACFAFTYNNNAYQRHQ